MLDWLVFGLIVLWGATAASLSGATEFKPAKRIAGLVIVLLCFIAAVHVWSAWL